MAIDGYIRITRPVNALVAGVAVLLGYLVATGTIEPWALILVPVVTLITGAGNAINDYYDRDIDKINRPDRPIPAGQISPRNARFFSVFLFAGGIALASFTNPLCLAIAIINAGLLAWYAASLKKLPVVGNIVVAYLSASIFLFGGALAGIEGLIMNLPIAAITFLAMFSREILKDAEDIEGDRTGGARTLPMIIGVRRSGAVALALSASAVVLSVLPLMQWWGIPYLVAITIPDLIILTAGVKGCACTNPDCLRTSNATTILKYGMFLALFVLITASILG
jgi:geranylgeranylglycerol-phosphate geranylgeranyltransferase